MEFGVVKQRVLERLANELHENLTYHCVDHTLDVMESAERLATVEGINGHDLCLIKTAALLHDLGFVETYQGHEDISIKMAGDMLPEFGYSEDDILKIQGMINSTKIPQTPANKLEEVLADADLDYLGRDDLFLIGQRLQYEWKMHGIISTLREWHIKQLAFLKAHHYFTDAAKKLRSEIKNNNIKELEDLLGVKK